MKGRVAYIVADLEGSTGAWTRPHTLLGTPEWQEARVELTRDINAVAESLWEMGVKRVVVKDFHRTGYNLIPKYLDRRVKLVSGYYIGPAVGYGNLHDADFALFVGLHAAGGNKDGFLSHTLTSRIAEILVNGERICEAELFATVLAAFKVPVCFFSGCPVACREAARKMEWLVTYEIAKDPEIYGDEKKRREYIHKRRQGLKAKIKKISSPEKNPFLRCSPHLTAGSFFTKKTKPGAGTPGTFLRRGKLSTSAPTNF